MIYNKEEIIKAGWNRYKINLAEIEPVNIIEIDFDIVVTDLVKSLYSNTSLWWVLLEYNKLPTVPTIKIGTEIKVFSLRELDDMTIEHLKFITEAKTNPRGLT